MSYISQPFQSHSFSDFGKSESTKAFSVYWSNPPFLFFWHSSARVPECQKIKKGGLDQYNTEHFEV